jgi:hypothetical protein
MISWGVTDNANLTSSQSKVTNSIASRTLLERTAKDGDSPVDESD